MRKTALFTLLSLALASAAFAKTPADGISVSTDPARAAAVERHAQDLKSQQASQAAAKSAAKSAAHHPSSQKTTHKASHKSTHKTSHKTTASTSKQAKSPKA
jgi:hypothetical protein